MTYQEIFEAYYALYRLESDAPSSTEDEYLTGIKLANEAIRRWSGYDGTYWKELFTTLNAEQPTTISTSVTYDAPDNFKEAGGLIRILDTDGSILSKLPIINPEEVQFKDQNAKFVYFTGDPGNGYVLHFNTTPDSSIIGKSLDYDYYKTPTLFVNGTSTTEMAEPYYIVHRMLANAFRGSRNPYYSSAKSDAEDALRTMQLDNNSGSWANPWSLGDTSGTSWGA